MQISTSNVYDKMNSSIRKFGFITYYLLLNPNKENK